MSRVSLFLAAAAMVLCSVTTVYADHVYYSEDFESQADNTIPGGWSIIWNGQGDAAQGVRAEANGNRYLRVAGRYGWSGVLLHEFSSPMADQVLYSFQAQWSSGDDGAVEIGNGTVATYIHPANLGVTDTNWHSVTMAIDFVNEVFTATLDGNAVYSGICYPQTQGGWSPYSTNPAIVVDSAWYGEIHVDNISIVDNISGQSVPLPATIWAGGVLMVGLAAFHKLRRR